MTKSNERNQMNEINNKKNNIIHNVVIIDIKVINYFYFIFSLEN